jgi:hypothetical protein
MNDLTSQKETTPQSEEFKFTMLAEGKSKQAITQLNSVGGYLAHS